MDARVGATFLVGALGPVNFAGGFILASRVPEGLHELAPDNLFGGVQHGIAQTAKRVGVGAQDVERLLPMSELRSIIARIGLSQKNALAAWSMHAGPIGGLLKGVADLTADGRALDVGLCLERLSNKVSRDTELAEPLRALAADITSWQDVLARCRDILDDGKALERAFQRRRIRQMLFAIVPAVIAVIALAVGLWIRAAQRRVDKALGNADPCVVSELAPSDLARSSGGQKSKVDERRLACQAKKDREELAHQEVARREAEAREAERQRKEREVRCEALATHLAGGRLLPEDEAFAGDKAALLRRIARGALAPADFGPDDPPLPCGDTPSGARLEAAFSKAVRAVPSAWANAPDPSAAVRTTLLKHVRELPSAPKQVVAYRADSAAKRALLVGTPGSMARAIRLCELKEAVGIPGGSFCPNVLASNPKKP